MGTRKPYVGTLREQNDRQKRTRLKERRAQEKLARQKQLEVEEAAPLKAA